jgi:hypothetical protein
LTGGNARAGIGPTQTFEFDVPKDATDLSLGLHVSDSQYALEGLLVDPHGMPLSVGGNFDPNTLAQLNAFQLYHEHPQPGRWHFVLVQEFTSSGNQTSLPFDARIRLTSVPYAAPKLPDGPHHKISASGPGLTVPITITNASAVPQEFFADARLKERANASLPYYLCSNTNTLPGICLFTYVPPEVNDILFLAQSTVPINMVASNANGFGPAGFTDSPEIFAETVGVDTVAASLRTHEVPWTFWAETPSLVGPYGPGGAQTAPVSAAVEVSMRPFDPAVSSDSGNLYSDLVVGTNTFNPLVLAPGASGVINVTITPDPSKVGQIVRGYIFLDNFNSYLEGGDEVTRIPYEYTVTP